MLTYTFLKHPPLILADCSIETERCILKPFHRDGVDFEKLTKDFCDANRDLFVSQFLPTVEEEKNYIQHVINSMEIGEALEFFIYEKSNEDIIGCYGINALASAESNIGLWIARKLHKKGLGSEVYAGLINWIQDNTHFTFLRHGCNPANIASQELAKKFGGVLQDGVDEKGVIKFYIPLPQE